MAVQTRGSAPLVFSSKSIRAIALSAIAGWIAIDIYMSGVYLVHGISPVVLFQWDASNIVGRSAYAGGMGAAALGGFFDLLVSLVWASLCVLAVTRVKAAASHPVVFGALFGALVMFAMIWIVVPLGLASHHAISFSDFLTVLVGHTAFFGIPVALSARSVLGRP